MAWRLNTAVVKGEIDNTEKGRVTGRIWLYGRENPVNLELEGNCREDIAGCTLKFRNPDPYIGEEDPGLNANQIGKVGDMTASRKVRVFDCTLEEAMKMKDRGEIPPEHKGNCVYLEWYSRANGRIVIESPDYELEMGERCWYPDEKDEEESDRNSAEAMANWMDMLTNATAEAADAEDAERREYDKDEETLDEWGWEQFMREFDSKAEMFSQLIAQYKENPDILAVIENEMGWGIDPDWLDSIEDEDEYDDYWEMEDAVEPDPLTEGKDWILNEQGRIEHPLVEETDQGIETFVRRFEKDGVLNAENTALLDMLTEAQLMMVKMASVLNNVAYGLDLDNAFIVATLKRSLKYFDRSMEASEIVGRDNILGSEKLGEFRQFMFKTRMAVIDTMESYRKNRK